MNNILNACTLYAVDLLKIDVEVRMRIDQAWGNIDADCTSVIMTLDEIEEFEIPEDAINFDTFEFDEEELKYILENNIGSHPYYLTFGRGMKWNGANGYKFCRDIISTCMRDYDISLFLQETGKHAILCTEYSHDVPTGHPMYIIGLSKDEYSKLESASFNEIEQFVLTRF